MENYHETNSHYGDRLAAVRYEIIEQSKCALEHLGGRICFRHYHEFEDTERNVFFEVDDDGYGHKLFLDTAETRPDGTMEILLHDSEDSYCPYWKEADLSATDSLYLLSELEDIISLTEASGRSVVTEYDPEYEREDA